MRRLNVVLWVEIYFLGILTTILAYQPSGYFPFYSKTSDENSLVDQDAGLFIYDQHDKLDRSVSIIIPFDVDKFR